MSLRLREDLDAIFVVRAGDGHRGVATIEEAQGVQFLCPRCYNDDPVGKVGTHSIICWSRSRGVSDDIIPGPGRWKIEGTSLQDVTLNAEQPGGARSVQLNGGCGWHGFINSGIAVEA